MGNLSRRELLKKGIAAGALVPIVGLPKGTDAGDPDPGKGEITKLWKPGDTDVSEPLKGEITFDSNGFWQAQATGRFKSTLSRDLQQEAKQRIEEYAKLKHVLDKHGIRMVDRKHIRFLGSQVSETNSLKRGSKYDVPYMAYSRNEHWHNVETGAYDVNCCSLELENFATHAIEHFAARLDNYLTEHARIAGAGYYKTITNLRVVFRNEALGYKQSYVFDPHMNVVTHPQHPLHNPEHPLNNPDYVVFAVSAHLGVDEWEERSDVYIATDRTLRGFIPHNVQRVQQEAHARRTRPSRAAWRETEDALDEMSAIYKHLMCDRSDSEVISSAFGFAWDSVQNKQIYVSEPVAFQLPVTGSLSSDRSVLQIRHAIASLLPKLRELAMQSDMLVSMPSVVPLRHGIRRGMQDHATVRPVSGMGIYHEFTRQLADLERGRVDSDRVKYCRVELVAMSKADLHFDDEVERISKHGDRDRVLADWIRRSKHPFNVEPGQFKRMGPQTLVYAQRSPSGWTWKQS